MTRGGGIEPAETKIGASLGDVEFCLEIACEGRARGFATGLNTAPPFSIFLKILMHDTKAINNGYLRTRVDMTFCRSEGFAQQR